MKNMMRKVITVFTVLGMILVSLTGCSNVKEIDTAEERVIRYESFLSAIEANDSFVYTSNYFDMEGIMNLNADGTYRYDVVIENPRIAMYDVQVLCVPRDATGTLQTKDLCPSAGILEEASYNLVPNQTNKDKGYPAGVIVSGVTKEDTVTLEVLVVWNGYARLAENRQFLELTIKYTEPEPEPAESGTGA